MERRTFLAGGLSAAASAALGSVTWLALGRSGTLDPLPPRDVVSGDDSGDAVVSDPDADLHEVARILDEEWSYRFISQVDIDRALIELRARFGTAPSRNELGVAIGLLLRSLGDGHTRVQGLTAMFPIGYLPASIRWAEGRSVATSIRGGLLDPRHPDVVAIDGVDFDTWLAAAAPLAIAGSPDLRMRTHYEGAGYVTWIRRQLGLAGGREVAITLGDGSSEVTRHVPLLRAPIPWLPLGEEARTLRGALHIPLRSLRPGAHESSATQFRENPDRPVVIDLRGNGGGVRDAIFALVPHLLDPSVGPIVVNAAARRLPPGSDRSAPWLDERSMYPAGDERHGEAGNTAIEEFLSRFEPEVIPPRDGFSDWHFLVVAPDPNYQHTAPVAVLTDSGTFSAADILTGALAATPRVLHTGTTTGGGSGLARGITLPSSQIRLAVSTMASYQADGTLFERGIEPEHILEPTIDDVARATDTQLDRTVALLADTGRP